PLHFRYLITAHPLLLVLSFLSLSFHSYADHRDTHTFPTRRSSDLQNETQKEIAGIQSATSRQNTKDQVYAQNEMLAYQQKESTARVASIMENTNLSKQQQVSEIMRQMLTQAQT